MTRSQLKVRIQLNQSAMPSVSVQDLPEQPDEPILLEPPVYHYKWRRILVSVLALLLIPVVIFQIASAWLSADEVPDASPVDMLSLSETLTFPEHKSVAPLQSSLPAELKAQQLSENEQPRAENAGQSMETAMPTIEPEAPIGPDPGIKPAVKPLSLVLRAESSGAGRYIHRSPSVTRAQLTSNIRQYEPIDDIDRIALAGKLSRPIFLFLHLHKLRGEKVTVDWFYQERRVARVTLPVGNDDWRTNSSKVLNKNRLGSWRVTASDQSGKQLAEFSFMVIR